MQPINNTDIENYTIINGMVISQGGALCFANIDSNFKNQQFIASKGENLSSLRFCVQYVKSGYITV